jgi:hypothetical protein
VWAFLPFLPVSKRSANGLVRAIPIAADRIPLQRGGVVVPACAPAMMPAEAAATSVDDVFTRVRHTSPTALTALRVALPELTAGIDSREAVANHLAFLYLDLTDPQLGAHAVKQSRLFRRALTRLLEEAITSGEIDHTDPAELADTVYTIYNGALVTWAIDGTGSLARWLSERLDRVLAHHQPA